MALSKMFKWNPLLRKHIATGFLTLTVLVVISLSIINYNMYPWISRRPLSGRSVLRYDRLQPLRDMFENASKVKDIGQRSNLEGTGKTKVTLSDLQEVNNKVSVLLLVIVSTAPSRYERREAIRATWWKNCDGTEVTCKFFTDGLQLSEEQERELSTEQKTHGDIEFMALESTRNFGLRYLYHIMWATAKFNFVYLLRVDDDYFVCLERLKAELYHRPTTMLIWGSYHCSFQDLIYVDEAWILFTSDVIERFLSQDPRSMLCHPHADQQISVWLNKLYGYNQTLVHFDDHRLHHFPPARELDIFDNVSRVCDSHLGVHGSSPEMIRNFWRNSGDGARLIKRSLTLTRITETCHFPNVFNISLFDRPPYQFELRPCIANPRWTPNEGMWLGTHQEKVEVQKVSRQG
ncbi:hypothetical protein OS493_008697 [Desmophyllum pertusum]|uniref:Hexosyltransferase n=1 Tax=Desmophyllum pertusum TaxID=174260 RepID=A0A9W9ZS75_9CNID|nr:hypothetical protein OS493_008697 [Desmophyllum pertusum]